MKLTREQLKQEAEDDLFTFAILTNPGRYYGAIHREVFGWLQDNNLSQLLLLPRSHMKSHCIAVWVCWWIVKHPETTVLYVSATEKLALQQMYAIKATLESEVVRRYWPELVNVDEGKREKWSATEIKVDHPDRKKYGVRDATCMVASVGSNTTGLHCDVLVLDDLVVPDNAYTDGGRADVSASYSQFASIANPGAIVKACGTRYHPKDIYGEWVETRVEVYNDQGEIVGEQPDWEVFERVVHDEENVFLWPRGKDPKSGKWYGFDLPTLARIRARYFSSNQRSQYYAQYFNDPNAADSARVEDSKFQYLEVRKLKEIDGKWWYNGEPLAIFLGGDFAFTTGKRSDYTAYAVVGVTPDNFKLILDLDQFKTDRYEDYFQALFRLQRKWGFRKGKVEVNAGANVIANYLKDRIREEGLLLGLDVKNSSTNKGERTAAILEPEYANSQVLHTKGGWTDTYEEQVRLTRPPHDDLRDAVTVAFEIAKAPGRRASARQPAAHHNVVHVRFGGRG